jgi:hypothetical protein
MQPAPDIIAAVALQALGSVRGAHAQPQYARGRKGCARVLPAAAARRTAAPPHSAPPPYPSKPVQEVCSTQRATQAPRAPPQLPSSSAPPHSTAAVPCAGSTPANSECSASLCAPSACSASSRSMVLPTRTVGGPLRTRPSSSGLCNSALCAAAPRCPQRFPLPHQAQAAAPAQPAAPVTCPPAARAHAPSAPRPWHLRRQRQHRGAARGGAQLRRHWSAASKTHKDLSKRP